MRKSGCDPPLCVTFESFSSRIWKTQTLLSQRQSLTTTVSVGPGTRCNGVGKQRFVAKRARASAHPTFSGRATAQKVSMGEPATKIPQAIAFCESGSARTELTFRASQSDTGITAFSSDDLYDYEASASTTKPVTGTLFIRNKETGEVKVVPVGQVLQIARRCQQQEFQRVENAQTADLITHFGSRTAKRIYSQRQGAAK